MTMGMPSVFYPSVFRFSWAQSFERSILAFAGIGPGPARAIIGMVDGRTSESRGRWLSRIQALGNKAR